MYKLAKKNKLKRSQYKAVVYQMQVNKRMDYPKTFTQESAASSNKSSKDEWIRMIQNRRYDEFAIELVNQNIDLAEPIEKGRS